MKKFIKILKIIIINVILIILIDFIFYYYVVNEEIKKVCSRDKCLEKITLNSFPKYSLKLIPFEEEYSSTEFRPIMNHDSKKRPIIIFGCSYAYGYIFDNSETISYVMSKISDRPIYNRAMNGWGIQHVIYQLNDDKFVSSFVDNTPKYVFWVLMEPVGHFHRLYCTNFITILDHHYYLSYKKSNNGLIRRNPLFQYNLNIFRYIQNLCIENYVKKQFSEIDSQNKHSELLDLFILHFKTINKFD